MALTVGLTENRPSAYQAQPCRTPLNAVYHIVCDIFRALSMCIWYAVAATDLFVYKWQWFSTAIDHRHLKVRCSNIAGFGEFFECLKTAMFPLPRQQYQSMGRNQDLRVTHDLILHPSGGLCLGVSLDFLSHYFIQMDGTIQEKLIMAANGLDEDGKARAVRLQALYSSFLGVRGFVDHAHIKYYGQLFKEEIAEQPSNLDKDLLTSIRSFVDAAAPKSLRQFVFADLERRDVEITPDLYALTLELHALWKEDEHKFAEVHNDIMRGVADVVNLEIADLHFLDDTVANVSTRVHEFDDGAYLIHSPRHTVVMVKWEGGLALFDPNKGLGIFDGNDVEEGLLRLLNYYGSNGRAAISLSRISSSKQ